MDIHALISQYGYAALIVGSLAEGETITLLGGVAAHQKLLYFPLVILCVALGGMIGDQLLYLAGRYFGHSLLSRIKKYQDKIVRAQTLINQHPWLFVIGSRFMYGFRIIGPVLIGASHLPPKIFFPLNIIGALLWATLFTTIGYLGGELVAPWFDTINENIRRWGWIIFPVLLLAWLAYFLMKRKKCGQR